MLWSLEFKSKTPVVEMVITDHIVPTDSEGEVSRDIKLLIFEIKIKKGDWYYEQQSSF